MELSDLIDRLKQLPQDRVIAHGFDNPHSWRGDYSQLAFEPADHVTVGEMLKCAIAAKGASYEGWKGGTYQMSDYTDVYLAERGTCGEPITNAFFDLILAQDELLRLAAENAALMADSERLKKALDQAVDAGSLDIVTVVKDKSYGMWRYEGVECIVGQSSTENFFAGHPADMPELAAYLKEKA